MKSEREIAQERMRVRLLYSLGDFNLANSAVTFLGECDPDEKYSRVQLRRYRCYETTAIVAYTRPFSEAKGEIPRLPFGMVSKELTEKQKRLHGRLMRLRNKVFAHSDTEMMRMFVRAFPIEIKDGRKFAFPEIVFDEGLTFIGAKHRELGELMLAVISAICERLFPEIQQRPKDFNLRKDYRRTV